MVEGSLFLIVSYTPLLSLLQRGNERFLSKYPRPLLLFLIIEIVFFSFSFPPFKGNTR